MKGFIMHRFSQDDLEVVILIAATKLNKYNEIAKDEEARRMAIQFFEERSKSQNNAQDLANTALLGVMSVYIPGEVQPTVTYNWGNETGVPDVSPFDGGTGGGSTLDEVNRIDYRFGQDNLGVEARVIANYLNASEFSPDFIEYLQQNGIDINSDNHLAPRHE